MARFAAQRFRASVLAAFEAADLRRFFRRLGAALPRQRLRARFANRLTADTSQSTSLSSGLSGEIIARPLARACEPGAGVQQRLPGRSPRDGDDPSDSVDFRCERLLRCELGDARVAPALPAARGRSPMPTRRPADPKNFGESADLMLRARTGARTGWCRISVPRRREGRGRPVQNPGACEG